MFSDPRQPIFERFQSALSLKMTAVGFAFQSLSQFRFDRRQQRKVVLAGGNFSRRRWPDKKSTNPWLIRVAAAMVQAREPAAPRSSRRSSRSPSPRCSLRCPKSGLRKERADARAFAASRAKFRRTDVRVPVHLAETYEFGVLQTGYHLQNTLLLAVFDVALEPDDVVSAGHQILQPQLHTGVRLSPRARIDEPDGLHRPEAQRVAAASRDLFYRQTALEELLLAVHAPMRLDFLRRHQSVIKPVVPLSTSGS